MYYDINKAIIKEISEAPGEVRGVVFKTDEQFILEKGGKEKLKDVEKELEEMGHPLSYKEVKTMDFYPWGKRALSLLAISIVLNMDKDQVEEMGKRATKKSLMVRFFMRHFLSLEGVFKKASEMWRQHHTIGRLEVAEADMEKRRVVLRLYNLNFHPIFCDYLRGYFAGIGKIVEGEDVSCEETKCYFKGESFFHEFVLQVKN